MYYTNHYDSPIGGITLASNGSELVGLWFDGQKYFADTLPERYEEKDLPIFDQTKKWLDIYFSGKEPDFTPPLSMNGISPFRKRVWEIMLAIPFGQTSTYGQIAKQIEKETGRRASAQAVGGAVGRNSISLIIPCHRVVGTNGSFTGYAGGIDKKAELLKSEGVDVSKLTVPKKDTARC
ncbi:MAG: methylated-DNA--[protein]-cysteine S-methyltransferase [Firmicutes bacterium]|nr:methylated-DNA--[protein]-cysteine S-methyltransferase [Bacillota bacterium]